MRLKHYMVIWLVFTFLVALEYGLAHISPESSLFHQTVDPSPGRSLSLWLGWAGFILMLLMNAYSVKKRLRSFKNIGPTLQDWFNFHIFCGLLGPTFILFHSNLKVRGLVAVAFWSMLISVWSGLVGRYLYFQVGLSRQLLEKRALDFHRRLELSLNGDSSPQALAAITEKALRLAGAFGVSSHRIFWHALLDSVLGDIRLYWRFSAQFPELNWRSRIYLREFVLSRRRLLLIEPMNQMLAYWRAFHLPYAFFMYATAIVHVITTTLFQSMD